MTPAKIAQTILANAGSLGSGISSTRMKALLGGDGYRIALENRWLIPDMDGGELSVPQHPAQMQALREAAAKESVAPIAVPANPFSSIMATKLTHTTMTENNTDDDVGASVLVGDNGKTYSATIGAKNGDGTYTLSFGDDRPSNPGKRYRKEELNIVKKPGEAVNGAPAATSPVRAPGAPTPVAGSPAV